MSASPPPGHVAEEIISTEFVLPGMTNHLGTLFGGVLLAWMDKVAALAGQAYCTHNVVTASTEAVDFLQPIRLGDVVELRGKVVATFAHSMTARVRVRTRASTGGTYSLATTGYFNLVGVDTAGRYVAVPPVEPQGPEDEQDLLYAQQLRDWRKKGRPASG